MRYNTLVLIPPQAGKEETKMANEKILVVDDDKNICELLRLYLVKEGYNVTASIYSLMVTKPRDRISSPMTDEAICFLLPLAVVCLLPIVGIPNNLLLLHHSLAVVKLLLRELTV